jgi:AGCS family alanine or glycine:cation symporter
LGVGLMAWFNIIAILLYKKALLVLKDYENNDKGKDPIFNPEDIGVSNAHIGIR